jgi:hypothetical protein
MRKADHGGLGNSAKATRALRSPPFPDDVGNVDDVVHAACDPVIAIGVRAYAVAVKYMPL